MSTVMDHPETRTSSRTISAVSAPSVDGYSDEETSFESRSTGAFPAAALSSPMFEGKDVAGLIGAVVITLGPLAAYSFGWGA